MSDTGPFPFAPAPQAQPAKPKRERKAKPIEQAQPNKPKRTRKPRTAKEDVTLVFIRGVMALRSAQQRKVLAALNRIFGT